MKIWIFRFFSDQRFDFFQSKRFEAVAEVNNSAGIAGINRGIRLRILRIHIIEIAQKAGEFRLHALQFVNILSRFRNIHKSGFFCACAQGPNTLFRQRVRVEILVSLSIIANVIFPKILEELYQSSWGLT